MTFAQKYGPWAVVAEDMRAAAQLTGWVSRNQAVAFLSAAIPSLVGESG